MAVVWVQAEKKAVQELLRRLTYVGYSIDEIMQKETSPLYAADIITELKKKFACLPGGRWQDGSPIIIFPEYPAFREIGDQEFHNVLTYLTSIPSLSAAKVGFVLVIDRRQDCWACVKATLLRISGGFPGNLQMILVLRPSTLFQRTLSNILFKVFGEDFSIKVPVVMLNSVAELHSYIEQSQLTQELGGTQQYCHDTWISSRTDIEGFAGSVKRLTQWLQGFGRELQETLLPNTPLAVTNLLTTQSSKKDNMKRELAGAVGQGREILENIREPIRRDPDSRLNSDQLENLATVHRLLSQLNEISIAFDEFWLQHQNKLDLCLQICQFGHDFHKVTAELEQANDKVTSILHVGMSQTHTENFLHELNNVEYEAHEVLDKMQALVAEGKRLIDNCEYAEDDVRSKCKELQRARVKVLLELKSKRDLLLQAMELHQRLQSICEWCDDGIYLLASQQLDKCQSQEGAESILQELECYLDTETEFHQLDIGAVCREYESVLNEELKKQVDCVLKKRALLQEMFEKRRVSLKKLAAKQMRPVQPVAPTPEGAIKYPSSSPALRNYEKSYPNKESEKNYNEACPDQNDEGSHTASVSDEEENLAVLRRHVMNELLETERVYVEELLCVLEGYAAEMDNPVKASVIPSTLQNKKDVLFGNMQEICIFHKTIFLKELETYTDYPELVGRCFLKRMGELRIYEKYCHNKPRSESLWRKCSDCPFLQECQKKLEHKLGLDSYLLKPIQRITKYQLLLKEMIKYSKGRDGSVELQAALCSLVGILKAVNDSMHLIAITGYEGNLGDLGQLLMQGSFSVWAENKRSHVKMMERTRFKPMQRHLFLHEKALLFCKRRKENGEGYEKAPSYSFKQELSISAIGITEHAKRDNKKFEIWSSSRDEVYTVQAPSEETKIIWMREIQKLLTGQLETCIEASHQKTTAQLLAENNLLERPGSDRQSNVNEAIENQRSDKERTNDSIIPEGKKTERAIDSISSSETKPNRQEIKSDQTLLGWSNGSLSLEHERYFITEDQLTFDPEEEREKKCSAGEECESATDKAKMMTES